jgi:hypothetical protein
MIRYTIEYCLGIIVSIQDMPEKILKSTLIYRLQNNLPSPLSLPQRTIKTYFTSGIRIKVYKTRDSAPSTSSFFVTGYLLNMISNVYNGLVPTSPNTTPRV